MVASAQKNNLMNGTSNEHEAPMQNAAKAANPPTNGVNLNDQDLYQLLQRLPLDRSNHNVWSVNALTIPFYLIPKNSHF